MADVPPMARGLFNCYCSFGRHCPPRTAIPEDERPGKNYTCRFPLEVCPELALEFLHPHTAARTNWDHFILVFGILAHDRARMENRAAFEVDR